MRTYDALLILGGSRAEALARIEEQEEKAKWFLACNAKDRKRKKRKPLSVGDIRLKDLRRAYSRYLNRERGALYELFSLASIFSDQIWPEVVQRDLDRLISLFGANTTLAEVFALLRKEAERTDHIIGSDEVSASSHFNQEASTHGGDGNSGECAHPALTSTQERREAPSNDQVAPDGTSTANTGSHGLDNGDCETPTEDASSEGQPTCQGGNGADEATGEMGTPCANLRDTADQNLDKANQGPDCGGVSEVGADPTPVAGQGAHPAHRLATDDVAEDSNGGTGISGSPEGAPNSGGNNLDEAAAMELLASATARHAAKRLERALRSLIEATCAPQGAPGARYDGRRLIKELVAKRYALHRARREEREIRDIIIAVDTSGSCAGVVHATYAAAIAAACVLPKERVAVITHSNGYCVGPTQYCPSWMKTTLARWPAISRDYYSASQQEASREVWKEIAAQRPGMVLVLGDLDSAWAHDLLHEAGVRVVLMTNLPWLEMFEGIPYKILYGVHDIRTAAEAAENLARSGRLS